ncbi:hypothetical protein FACS1894200_00650 [Spirochaetia bacterium]|nr:hypothetical protein FACS1894200_00650 [Spirochaetia bacterium]
MLRVKYNAPVILTYAFLCALVLLLTQLLLPSLTNQWFTVGGRGSFSPSSLPSWVRLVSHAVGHSGWDHLLGNCMLLLLIGPILEEQYGSSFLFSMMLLTSLVTGILNVIFFESGIRGASGVVFMLILLSSFTNFSKGEIPLTFILIFALYLLREIFNSLTPNTVSEFAHIIGGFCGSVFGFFFYPKRRSA